MLPAKKPGKPPRAAKAKEQPTNYGDSIGTLHSLVNAMLDAMGPAAVLSSALLTALYYKIFVNIWADHCRIAARWPKGRAAEWYNGAPKPNVLVLNLKAKLLTAVKAKSADDAVAAWNDARVMAESAKAEAARRAECGIELPPQEERSVGGRFKDGTLDVVHQFSFPVAAAYAPMFFFCSVLSFLLSWILFELLLTALFFKTTRAIILGLFGTSMAFPVLMVLLEKFVVQQVVNKNEIKLPRTYLYYDLALAFSVAFTAGLSASFIRLITGLFSAYMKLVTLYDPVMPPALGTADAGLSVYGSLLKSRYMCIFEELALVRHRSVEYSDAPEAAAIAAVKQATSEADDGHQAKSAASAPGKHDSELAAGGLAPAGR